MVLIMNFKPHITSKFGSLLCVSIYAGCVNPMSTWNKTPSLDSLQSSDKLECEYKVKCSNISDSFMLRIIELLSEALFQLFYRFKILLVEFILTSFTKLSLCFSSVWHEFSVSDDAHFFILNMEKSNIFAIQTTTKAFLLCFFSFSLPCISVCYLWFYFFVWKLWKLGHQHLIKKKILMRVLCLMYNWQTGLMSENEPWIQLEQVW